MKTLDTKINNLKIIKPKIYRDNRGYFKELIREKKLKIKFPFIVMSYSKKNVIRGLHLQKKESQGKFISVIKGKIFDVALDMRKNSRGNVSAGIRARKGLRLLKTMSSELVKVTVKEEKRRKEEKKAK